MPLLKLSIPCLKVEKNRNKPNLVYIVTLSTSVYLGMFNRTHIKIDKKLGLLIYDNFKVVDTNGDGLIDQEQFKLLWRSLGQVISDRKLQALTEEVFSKIENGPEMDMVTFIDTFSLNYVHPPSNRSIHDAFNVLGLNKKNDLINVLSKGDDKLTEEEINRFVELANLKDDNTYLDYSDLVNLLTNKYMYREKPSLAV